MIRRIGISPLSCVLRDVGSYAPCLVAGEQLGRRTLALHEIMDKLEERVGPKGRKLFEQFLRKVNKLQAQQQLEAQAQRGVTERSGERGPV